MGCGSAKILHGSGQPSAGGDEGREVYSRGGDHPRKEKEKGGKAKKKTRRFGRSDHPNDSKFRRSQSQPAFTNMASSPTGMEDYQTAVAIKGNSRIRVTLSCDGSMLEIETERLSSAEQSSPEAGTSHPHNNSDTYQNVVQDLSYSSDSPTTSGHGALGLETRIAPGDHRHHTGAAGAPRSLVPRRCWDSSPSGADNGADTVIVCNKCGNSANLDGGDTIPPLPPYPATGLAVSKSISCPDEGLNELTHSDSCHCELCLPRRRRENCGGGDPSPPRPPVPPQSLPLEELHLDSPGDCGISPSEHQANTKTILLRCARCGNPIQKQRVVQPQPQQHQVTADVEWNAYRAGETRVRPAREHREGGGVGVWADGWGNNKGKKKKSNRSNKTVPVGELDRIPAFGSDDMVNCDNLDDLNCMSLPRAANNVNHHNSSSRMMVTSHSLPNAIVNLPNGDINGVQAKPPPRTDSLRCSNKPPPVPPDPARRPPGQTNGVVKDPKPAPRRNKGKLWLRKAHSENDAEVNIVSLPNGTAGNHNNSSIKVFRSLDHGPSRSSSQDNPGGGMHRTFSTMSSLSTQETILSRASSASSTTTSSSFSSTRKWRRKIGENAREQIVEVGLMMSNPVKHQVEYEMSERSIREQEIDECFEEYNNFVYPEAIMDALEAQLVEIHVHEDFYNDFSDFYDDEDLES